MSDAEKMAEQGWAEIATERARVIRDIKSALRSSEAECARLRERVRVLEEALRPFAEATPRGCDLSEIGLASLVSCDLVGITGDEIRAARAALEGKP